MSTSGSKSNEHVAHFLVDIHNLVVDYSIVANPRYYKCEVISYYLDPTREISMREVYGLKQSDSE